MGFVLPYIFVLRPALLMLAPDGSRAPLAGALGAFAIALLGVLPLAAAVTGRLFTELNRVERIGLFAVAAFTLLPGGSGDTGMMGRSFTWWNLAAVGVYIAAALYDRSRRSALNSL